MFDDDDDDEDCKYMKIELIFDDHYLKFIIVLNGNLLNYYVCNEISTFDAKSVCILYASYTP